MLWREREETEKRQKIDRRKKERDKGERERGKKKNIKRSPKISYDQYRGIVIKLLAVVILEMLP